MNEFLRQNYVESLKDLENRLSKKVDQVNNLFERNFGKEPNSLKLSEKEKHLMSRINAEKEFLKEVIGHIQLSTHYVKSVETENAKLNNKIAFLEFENSLNERSLKTCNKLLKDKFL